MTKTKPHIKGIRKRASYKMFQRMLIAFRKSEKIGLEQVHMEMDNKNAYGSLTLSLYAKESLNQLLKDINAPEEEEYV